MLPSPRYPDDNDSGELCHGIAWLLISTNECGLLRACRISLERWFPKATVFDPFAVCHATGRAAVLLEDHCRVG